jgi:two-component system, probable response regulator PhcQ
MQNTIDYKRYAILYVDDEEMALKYFEKSFGAEFRILTAVNAEEGAKKMANLENQIGVLMSDQRMPGQKGVQLLEQVRLQYPQVIRMLITAYADYGVTVDAVNIGNVFRYVTKPIQVQDMRNTLRRAIEFYTVQRERDDLMREKLSALQQVVIVDRVISLGVLAAGLGSRLRNPMQAVQSFLGLMRSALATDPSGTVRLHDPVVWGELHSHVIKQATQVSGMLGVDGEVIVQSEEEEVDLPSAVRDALSARASDLEVKSIEARVSMPPGPIEIHTNRKRLRKVIDLLIEGELSMLPKGSVFTLQSEVISDGGRPIGMSLEITDKGPGLHWAELRSVIDPSVPQTAGSHEVGLRLMVLFLLVHDLGGEIRVNDTRGKGTSLRLEFPFHSKEPSTLEESSRDFIAQVLSNDLLWDRLLTNG